MPKEPARTRSSRQRPISCLFCRSRKLRCSRDAPCTNCTSRGIECELETIARASSETSGPSKTELLERIRTLEQLLQSPSRDTQTQPSSYVGSPAQSETHTLPTTNGTKHSPNIEHLDNDVAWLSSIYDGSTRAPDDLPTDKVAFRISPMASIIESSKCVTVEKALCPKGWPRKVFWIPPYSEATILLTKFCDHVEYIHHVFYMAALPAMLDRIYSQLSQKAHIKSGEIVLLVSIFASATRAWTEFDSRERGLFATTAEAHSYTSFLVEVADDLLDIARRSTRVSIEGVQACIVLLFVPENVEAFWRRCRALHTTGVSLARELGLHCIDLPSKTEEMNTIQAEIGRRVWWHLVASDWAVATRIDDIPRGFYQCHPRHMLTHQPLNLDDEDLADGMLRVGRPMCQPTHMTYSLFRIRVSEISRHLADRTGVAAFNSGGPSYDIVMDIDTELNTLLNDLPPFFSMPVADISRIYLTDERKATCIARQGHIFRSLCHGQRCKLHLSFLGRGYTDSNYALSRDACVESARIILRLEMVAEESGICAHNQYRPLGLIMAVFIACIVLLMDLCHSKGTTHHERQRSEISSAFRLLEDVRHESAMAAKLITSMMHVLHKHQITPPNMAPAARSYDAVPALTQAPPATMSTSTELYGVPGLPNQNGPPCPVMETVNNTQTFNGNGGFDSSYFPDLAQSLDQGMTIDNFNWNDLFLDLETAFA